jgi:hypothetical protein
VKNYITKSNYLSGLQCIRKLWLSVYDPEKAAGLRAFQEMVLKRGTGVGELARTRFSGGVMVEAPYSDISGALEETADLIKDGAER